MSAPYCLAQDLQDMFVVHNPILMRPIINTVTSINLVFSLNQAC
jgi:hypothetical protein